MVGSVGTEAELLLLMARQDPSAHALARAAELASQDVDLDWARFLSLAVQHRVARLAGWHAASLRAAAAPAETGTAALALLHDTYIAGAARSSEVKAELTRILTACAGLHVAIRKGAHLAFHVYRQPGVRPMDDFDLLVSREHAADVVAALSGLGYREGQPRPDGGIEPLSRRQRIFWRLHGSDLPTLSRAADGPFVPGFSVDISVELALPGKGFRVPVAEFLDRARPSSIGGAPCLVLAPEDAAVDLCLHLYKNSTSLRFMALGKHRRLLKYVDIGELVASLAGAFEWQAVLDRAEAMGIAGPVYYALAHLEELFPGTVPAPALDNLAGTLNDPAAFLQQYGQWDLAEPLSWQLPFAARFFDSAADSELPQSRSLV